MYQIVINKEGKRGSYVLNCNHEKTKGKDKDKIKGCLKESLHIILMTIVFFEINQLHSLGYRQMITKEKVYEKISSRVQLSYNIQ